MKTIEYAQLSHETAGEPGCEKPTVDRVADEKFMRRRTLWLVLAALLLCSCAATSVADNPETRTRLQALKSVSVLSPDVQLVRRFIGGSEEQLRAQDAQASTELITLVAAQFSSRGFAAKQGPAAAKVTADTQSAYDQIAYGQRYELEHPTLQAVGNLAAPAAAIAKQTGADGLVFVKLEGYKRSAGSIAGEVAAKTLIAAATGGMLIPLKDANAAASLGVTLVDARTGDVLWSNVATEAWGLTVPDFGESDLANLVTKAFANFPALGADATTERP
jgi:hypothetical protein